VLVHLGDRLLGVHNLNHIGMQSRLSQKTLTHSRVIGDITTLHAVCGAGSTAESQFHCQIQHKSQMGQQSARSQSADLPEPIGIESACMTLINYIGQEKAVGDDGSASIEGGPDHVGGELGAAGHEQEGFARK
jgi:hypothetical protein